MRLPLSTFLNFCTSHGTNRIGEVQEAVSIATPHVPDMTGTYDFYLQIRQAIVDMHSKGVSPIVLDFFLHAQTDERRRRIYPGIIEGYRKFLADRGPRVAWFPPPSVVWPCGELELRVAPELGLNINGVPHIVALWFGGDRASATMIKLHLAVLSFALGSVIPGATMALLDVRLAKLHTLYAPTPRVNLLLRAEAAAFATIWRSL